MIKTTKKTTGQDIESVIAAGKAEIKTSIKGSVGRPKNKVLKKLCYSLFAGRYCAGYR